MSTMGFEKVTNNLTTYEVNWKRVAITLLYIVLLTWIIVFGMNIPVLARHMSGRCYSHDFDTGKETAKMLAFVILLHGTFVIGAVLGCLHSDQKYWIPYGMYVTLFVVLSSAAVYAGATPDACFVSYSDMLALLICANILYMVAGVILSIALVAGLGMAVQKFIKALPAIWTWIKAIPSFYIREKTIETELT